MKDPRMTDALSHLTMTDTQKHAVFERILAAAEEPSAPASQRTHGTTISVSPRQKRRSRIRPLAAAAAVLLVFGITLCIPEVSNALRALFHNSFRIEEYLATPSEEREYIAEYEAAIQAPDPFTQSCCTELLSETDRLDEVNTWRSEQGFVPYDPAAYEWCKDLRCEVTEVFYDGKSLYANLTLNESPLKFFWNDTPYPTEDMENFDIAADRFGSVLETTKGTVAPMYASCWLNQEKYWKSGTGEQDNEALHAAAYTDLEASWEFDSMPALPDGPVTVTMPIWVMDGSIDDFADVGRVARMTVTFTFDATAGNASLTERGKGSMQLSGSYPATFVYDTDPNPDVYRMVYELRNTDLSGIAIRAEVLQRSTGLWIGLTFEGPSNWAYDENQLQQLWFRLLYDVYLDGTLVRERAHLSTMGWDGSHGIELSLTESEIGAAKEIRLVPYMEYVSAYQPPEDWVLRQEAFHKEYPNLNDLPAEEISRLLGELEEAQRAAATAFEIGKPTELPGESNLFLDEVPLDGCELILTLE